MIIGRGGRAVAAGVLVAAALGCGLGSGPASEGDAHLSVTRDYGSELIAEATRADPPASETVLRLLDRETEIETRYGGGFVQSINDLAGTTEGGRRRDWFFYVNGVESPIGATGVTVEAGDRIWWDYRDWTAAMRVPAVVGQWPEPFAQAADDSPARVTVECAAEARSCEAVAERVEATGAGVDLVDAGEAGGADGPRVLVGPWARIGRDEAAAELERGPAATGVFALPRRWAGGWRLDALDERGETMTTLGAGAGLVAALRPGEDAPTWLVTGTDAEGVTRAAAALGDDELRNRYALAVPPRQQAFGLPRIVGAAP